MMQRTILSIVGTSCALGVFTQGCGPTETADLQASSTADGAMSPPLGPGTSAPGTAVTPAMLPKPSAWRSSEPVAPPVVTATAPQQIPVAGNNATPVATTTTPTTTTTTMTPAMAPVDISNCPPAPPGATDVQLTALDYFNSVRIAAGAGCVTMVAEINQAADNHCKYVVDPANKGMCTSNAHAEVMGCAGFTGARPGQRMAAAGYMPRGGGEVMAFVSDPKAAVDTWVNSVWHRTPMLDPWTRDMGYGTAAGGCDTIDFGNPATDVPATTVLVYPYDGQTDVPTTFNGAYEGPMPPAPPSGWPSASPVTLYARKLVVTEHVLTKEGDPTPLEHTWIDNTDEMSGVVVRSNVFMYAHTPFMPNTKYQVSIKGTSQAGALDKLWSFTTGAAPTWGGRSRP